jgi:hypothetical protein
MADAIPRLVDDGHAILKVLCGNLLGYVHHGVGIAKDLVQLLA